MYSKDFQNRSEMKHRLFIGIHIPTQFQDSLLLGLTPLMDVHPEWRWVNKINFHITVSFFGEVETEEIPSLIKTLENVTTSFSPFNLRITKLLFAPPQSIPRMLWAINQENEEFISLVESIEDTVIKMLI